VPIAGVLGDQQAATFGQACLSPGEAKSTYGTGNFRLLNTGTEKVMSETACSPRSKIGSNDTFCALEGSVAVTGSLVQWRGQPRPHRHGSRDREARRVEDNGGAYFGAAFLRLFAPYWRSDAHGAIVHLTRFVNKGRLARAVLEAIACGDRRDERRLRGSLEVGQGRRRHGSSTSC
jgi:glycerol kinase